MTPLALKINKIHAYILNKYDKKSLSNFEACQELQCKGSELGRILYTPKLPSLSTRDIAIYIVLHT